MTTSSEISASHAVALTTVDADILGRRIPREVTRVYWEAAQRDADVTRALIQPWCMEMRAAVGLSEAEYGELLS